MNKNIEVVFLPASSMLWLERSLTTDVELMYEALSRLAGVFFDGRIPFQVCGPSSWFPRVSKRYFSQVKVFTNVFFYLWPRAVKLLDMNCTQIGYFMPYLIYHRSEFLLTESPMWHVSNRTKIFGSGSGKSTLWLLNIGWTVTSDIHSAWAWMKKK